MRLLSAADFVAAVYLSALQIEHSDESQRTE